MVDIVPSLEVEVLGKTYDLSMLHQKPVIYLTSSLFQEEKIKRIKTSSDFSTPWKSWFTNIFINSYRTSYIDLMLNSRETADYYWQSTKINKPLIGSNMKPSNLNINFQKKISKSMKFFNEIRELFVCLKCTQREHVHNLNRRLVWSALKA